MSALTHADLVGRMVDVSSATAPFVTLACAIGRARGAVGATL